MKLISILTLSMALLSCKENLPVENDIEVVLEVGQTITTHSAGNKYVLSLSSIDENSLCPKTLVCIWGGRIIVTMKVNGFDYIIGNGDKDVSSELILGNTKVRIIDASDYQNDTSQWIKLKLEVKD